MKTQREIFNELRIEYIMDNQEFPIYKKPSDDISREPTYTQ